MDDHLRYDYAGDRRILEGADWIGCRPDGLRLHYHAEAQLSMVWNGYRDYRIGVHRLRLRPGQVLAIGRLIAHRALPSHDPRVMSAEFYVAPGALPADLARRLGRAAYLLLDLPDPPVLADRAAAHAAHLLAGGTGAGGLDWRGPAELVAPAIRTLSGLSREGRIRAFARQVGMTPHAHAMNGRLNAGRQMLREGAAIGEAAYASGFADQSHFGRLFRAFFGATPGRFRAAHHPR